MAVKINVMKVGSMIKHFIFGLLTMYVVWNFVPEILDIVVATGLVADFADLAGIIWYGIVVVTVIYTIGYPVWVLFDDDDEEQQAQEQQIAMMQGRMR